MDGLELKRQWRTGGPSFGTWIQLADPQVCAIVANIGFEWVIIDGEHCPFNPETLRAMFMVLRDRGVVPIVRVRVNDAAIIKQMLDWGAEGVMIPFIRTADDVRQAVASCRYPPVGMRGFNPAITSNYGKDIDRYMATANDRIICMPQIENADAVASLDEILTIPGVDALLIGPADLSFSMGLPLQTKHPQVQAAIDTVIRSCNAVGMPVGMAWGDTVEGYRARVASGLTFVPLGGDYDFMIEAGTQMLSRMREAVGLAPLAN